MVRGLTSSTFSRELLFFKCQQLVDSLLEAATHIEDAIYNRIVAHRLEQNFVYGDYAFNSILRESEPNISLTLVI